MLRHFRAGRQCPLYGAWCALVGLAVVPGCAARPAENSSLGRPAESEVRTEIERGPVRVTVRVSPAPARLSDEPELTLTIDSEAGVEVRHPPFGEAVGDFLIRDFRETLPEMKENRQIVRHVYTLEPALTGPAQIDPLVIEFTDNRPGGDGRRHRVETEALTVNVISVVGEDAPSLDGLKGYDAPLALPDEGSYVWKLAAAGGLLVAILATAIYLRARRRVPAAAPLSPREQAARELELLWQSQAADHDVKRFYVELTAIVRRYIERTTGIHAPEQTTEEFLREVGQGSVFSAGERQRLKDFLEAADLVKFAGYQPRSDDVEESFRRARTFVGQVAQEGAA